MSDTGVVRGAAARLSGTRVQPVVTGVAAAALGGGALYLHGVGGARLAALWIVGAALGFVLRHGAFGFTQGFRAMLLHGRSAQARAQLAMLGAAVLLLLPMLEAGAVFGQPVRGFVFPAGAAVAIGAFLFGVGMQLGGGCASGALFTVAGGSARMLLTLAFFVAGATLAAWAAPLWTSLPAPPPVAAQDVIGLWPALAAHAALFGLIWVWLARREQARCGTVEPVFAWRDGAGWLRGPWPYAWAGLGLALLNVATVLIAGRPWAITSAFPLWGSLALDAARLDDPAFWPYWEEPTRVEALFRPVVADVNSVMIVGLIVGALLGAGLSGRFSPTLGMPLGHAAASALGGLLLGVGATMATGCNISAYFSGIASGSLHGWLWIAAALPGTWVGARLRPTFGLDA